MSFKVKDHYYNKAKKENFLARSIYKLEEIDNRYSVLKKSDNVLDLGYYPGSWIQYTTKKVGERGHVIGVDIQDINKKLLHYKNITLFKKDIFELSTPIDLEVDSMFDVILSDMAPSTTGIKSVDQDRSYALVEQIFLLLPKLLKEGGNLVVKVFDGNDVQQFLKIHRKQFEKFDYLKPKSTRSISKEFFVIGRKFMLN